MVRISAWLELERIRVIENGLDVHFVESFLFLALSSGRAVR